MIIKSIKGFGIPPRIRRVYLEQFLGNPKTRAPKFADNHHSKTKTTTTFYFYFHNLQEIKPPATLILTLASIRDFYLLFSNTIDPACNDKESMGLYITFDWEAQTITIRRQFFNPFF